jgi:cobalamin biosynthesis protein CbiD
VLRYDFDGLVVFRHAADLTAILEAARAHKARRIAITGHRGSVLLSNGTTLTEQTALARRRAEQLATLLRGAGLTDLAYDIDWQDEPGAADGLNDAALRRATVELTP